MCVYGDAGMLYRGRTKNIVDIAHAEKQGKVIKKFLITFTIYGVVVVRAFAEVKLGVAVRRVASLR